MHGVALAHPPILIVMEYCSGGNLENHLTKSGDKIEMGERVVYALEAARGMRYLHDQHPPCVHRDLAARNCLISSKGTIKISDFGLSMVTKEIDGAKEEEPEASPQIPVRWMAPESWVPLQILIRWIQVEEADAVQCQVGCLELRCATLRDIQQRGEAVDGRAGDKQKEDEIRGILGEEDRDPDPEVPNAAVSREGPRRSQGTRQHDLVGALPRL